MAAGQVVRQALVTRYADRNPARAGLLWANHPQVVLRRDLDAIAAAAAAKGPVPRDRIAEVLASAARAPLAVEPYLVRGIDAELAGNRSLAGQAFAAAVRRDPRSVAARYFLADHDLKAGKIDDGLAELAVLTRLVPRATGDVAPYYAAFAKQAGGATRIKAMLATHPQLEPAILTALADDPANADLILTLSSARNAAEPPAWAGRLVQGLVTARQYSRARLVWLRLAGDIAKEQSGGLLFDPTFTRTKAPPPFGWALVSGGSGLAEAQNPGLLHFIYYGRDDVVLASQLLLLGPGRYRLSVDVERAGDATALGWRVQCQPSGTQIGALGLGAAAAPKHLAASFTVPMNCPAQLLELAGTAPEFPQTVDLTLSGLRLTEARP